MFVRCRFRGEEYLLYPGWRKDGSPLMTEEQYREHLTPFAHVFESGEIKRFNRVLGRVEELKVLRGRVSVVPSEEALVRAAMGMPYRDLGVQARAEVDEYGTVEEKAVVAEWRRKHGKM